MRFDSYQSPVAARLLRSARGRWISRTTAHRLLLTEGVAAALFMAAATALATLADWPGRLHLGALAVVIAGYLLAAQVTFPVAGGWTRPTQVVFVPMLFLLPAPLVPLVVAACLVLDLWPRLLDGGVNASRVLARIADSSYALGPALVFVLAGERHFDWDHLPLYALAFGAQVTFDAVTVITRTWFADRVLPSEQLEIVWTFATDWCLSCIGLLVAASAVGRPALVLFSLPLLALLGMFAKERQQRLDGTLELSTAYRGTALLLGAVVEGDHEYTGVHSREVVDMSLAVADEMGLGAEARLRVEFGALLHDVGKIRVPNDIINKPGRLTDEEWEIIRRHTVEGEAMLRQVGGVLAHVGRVVRGSHEEWDGSGYPDGLKGDEIPIESRIIAASDAFNAMTTDRAYRKARSPELALEELQRCSGTQFDPQVVTALTTVLRKQLAMQASRREPLRGADAKLHTLEPC
jgi:putative nucleotidyltransferase with HDIG domain